MNTLHKNAHLPQDSPLLSLWEALPKHALQKWSSHIQVKLGRLLNLHKSEYSGLCVWGGGGQTFGKSSVWRPNLAKPFLILESPHIHQSECSAKARSFGKPGEWGVRILWVVCGGSQNLLAWMHVCGDCQNPMVCVHGVCQNYVLCFWVVRILWVIWVWQNHLGCYLCGGVIILWVVCVGRVSEFSRLCVHGVS